MPDVDLSTQTARLVPFATLVPLPNGSAPSNHWAREGRDSGAKPIEVSKKMIMMKT